MSNKESTTHLNRFQSRDKKYDSNHGHSNHNTFNNTRQGYCPKYPENIKHNNNVMNYGSDNSYTIQNCNIVYTWKVINPPGRRNSQLVACNKSHHCESHPRAIAYK